jgi:predicted nucleic acid-binding protein
LIAAAGSPTGGSSFLLSLVRRGLLKGAVSSLVLLEAEGNILTKLPSPAAQRYYHHILTTPMTVAPIPSQQELKTYEAIVGGKDAHVMAAALSLQAPILLTLDRKLAERVNGASVPTERWEWEDNNGSKSGHSLAPDGKAGAVG